MNSALLHGFYLGEVLVEPLNGQLHVRDGVVHLPPRAMEVLLALAHDPEELVESDTLLAKVWGAGQGSREALSHAISDIRHALGDDHHNPVFIQTIPRRGYRLLQQPRPLAEDDASIVLGAANGARPTDVGFLENLQRRGVLETALAYLVVGWLLIQVADIVFARLALPDWVATVLTWGVVVGFPLALLLSWYFEIRDGRAVVDDMTPLAARRRRFTRTYRSVVGALALAAIGVFVFDRQVGLPQAAAPVVGQQEGAYEPPPIRAGSFAVLPFMNIDGSDTTQVFANGLVDDLITRLSRVPGLHVAARGDSFSLSPNSPSEQVRRRLRVSHYLQGSVETAGDIIRVSMQLIDAENGFHVLGRSFDRQRSAFFDLRDEITGLTVANVRVALPPGLQVSQLAMGEDPSVDAYVLYRRGVDKSREPLTPAVIDEALRWFDAALEMDADYVAAHAGRCELFADGYKVVDDPGFIAKAEAACARALQLNANLDVVYTALGELYSATGRYEQAASSYEAALSIDAENVGALTGLGAIYLRQQQPGRAEGVLRRAIDIHPGDTSTYQALGVFLFNAGRYEEAAQQYRYVVALEPGNVSGFGNLGSAELMSGNFDAAIPAFRRALEIEPTPEAHSNLGLLHYYRGEYEVAADNLRAAIDLNPNDYLLRSNLGDILWVAGDADGARDAFVAARVRAETALAVNPRDPFTLLDLAWINAMLGEPARARELMQQARRLAPDDPYTDYYDGLVHLQQGAEEAAVAALEQAVRKGYPKVMLAAEPHLAELHDNPRFAAMLK